MLENAPVVVRQRAPTHPHTQTRDDPKLFSVMHLKKSLRKSRLAWPGNGGTALFGFNVDVTVSINLTGGESLVKRKPHGFGILDRVQFERLMYLGSLAIL